ncbi:polysulfide reductase NrfD [Salmonella enterica subsp. enterica]|nr:polysulfide reductase NrfD [Salmonella enterica subsp. enterica]
MAGENLKRGDCPATALAAAVRIVQKVLALITPFHRALETLMLVLAVLLERVHRLLLSALKSYPFLNNPILPALLLFSGISSGAAVALDRYGVVIVATRTAPRRAFVHRGWKPQWYGWRSPAGGLLSGWRWAMTAKMRALAAALGGGFWSWWFWLGVVGLLIILPLLKPSGKP